MAICCPEALKFTPFQIKGNSVSHTSVSVKLVEVGRTVKFSVAMESQPVITLLNVDDCVSELLKVNPFQSSGSSVSHTVESVVLDKLG